MWDQKQQHLSKQAADLAGCIFDVEYPPSPRRLPTTPPTPKPCVGEDPLAEELVKEYKRAVKDVLMKSHKLHGAQIDLMSPTTSPEKRQKTSQATDDELSQLVAAGPASGDFAATNDSLTATQLWGPKGRSTSAPLTPTQPWMGSQKLDGS